MNTEETPTKILYTLRDTAAALSVSQSALRGWIRRGHLRSTRLGARVMVPAAEIARVAKQGLPKVAA